VPEIVVEDQLVPLLATWNNSVTGAWPGLSMVRVSVLVELPDSVFRVWTVVRLSSTECPGRDADTLLLYDMW
jgi:hypothetical protein